MTYALRADMVAELGESELAQLTDRTNATVIDDTVLNLALTRADDEINSYLAQRYSLPFSSTPARLKAIAMDIARYYLYDARVTQAVKDRYDRAVSWLKDVAAGKAVVGPDANANVIAPNAALQASVEASDQVFTDDVLALT